MVRLLGPFRAEGICVDRVPRALPWADESQPFGLAALTYREPTIPALKAQYLYSLEESQPFGLAALTCREPTNPALKAQYLYSPEESQPFGPAALRYREPTNPALKAQSLNSPGQRPGNSAINNLTRPEGARQFTGHALSAISRGQE